MKVLGSILFFMSPPFLMIGFDGQFVQEGKQALIYFLYMVVSCGRGPVMGRGLHI